MVLPAQLPLQEEQPLRGDCFVLHLNDFGWGVCVIATARLGLILPFFSPCIQFPGGERPQKLPFE